MRDSERKSWQPSIALLSILTLAAAAAVRADEPTDDQRRALREVVRLGECPEVKVLGSGVRVLSLSPRGFLGVEASNLTPELRRHFGVPEDAGVLLARVVPGSAAEAAGLEVGDVVTRVGEEEITTVGRLGSAVRQADGGETVEIEYWRGGEKRATRATLEERERCTFEVGDRLRALDLKGIVDLRDFDIDIDREALRETLRNVQETLGEVDWAKHFEGLKVIDLEQVEERMEELQERLEELEERIEKEVGDQLDRAREQREKAERDRERSERDRGGAPNDAI